MKLSFDDLEKALKATVESLKLLRPDGTLMFRSDFYLWSDSSRFFDVYSLDENELTVGQISDDLASLAKVADGTDEASLVTLTQLAAILIGVQCEILS